MSDPSRPDGGGAEAESSRPGHGWPGWLLCGALALLGALLALLALAQELVPPPLRPEAMLEVEEESARAVLLLGGLCLVALAWGVLRFRRWAWWGTVAVCLLLAWPALDSLLALLRGGAPPPGFLFQLAVVAALPYLWARRRDFGIGTTRRTIPRGP